MGLGFSELFDFASSRINPGFLPFISELRNTYTPKNLGSPKDVRIRR